MCVRGDVRLMKLDLRSDKTLFWIIQTGIWLSQEMPISDKGAHIIMAVRNLAKGKEALTDIKSKKHIPGGHRERPRKYFLGRFIWKITGAIIFY